MAYATINFHQSQTHRLKSAPVGFSWTTLFFGLFPALFRGHFVGAMIMALLSLVTFGLSWLIFPFIYNRMYINHLIGAGYRVSSTSADPTYLAQRLKLLLPLDEARPTFAGA